MMVSTAKYELWPAASVFIKHTDFHPSPQTVLAGVCLQCPHGLHLTLLSFIVTTVVA